MAITESGPVSSQVAQNIERVRKARQLKQKDLSERLRAVGRPMLPTVVSKVERGSDASTLTTSWPSLWR